MLQYSEECLLGKNCYPVSTRVEESPCEKERGQIYDENGSDTLQPLHFTCFIHNRRLQDSEACERNTKAK